jgi:hypothetical protein
MEPYVGLTCLFRSAQGFTAPEGEVCHVYKIDSDTRRVAINLDGCSMSASFDELFPADQLRHATPAERLALAEAIRATAASMYEKGRSDRVRGLPPSMRYMDDMYYVRGYKSEQGKEVVLL